MTVTATGIAAAGFSLIALILAVSGGTLLQLACSMWLEGRRGRIIQLGLGMILKAVWAMIFVLLAVVIYHGVNMPVLTIIPLV